ncbi:MAG: ATP-binding protein [Terriglobia bacterium]
MEGSDILCDKFRRLAVEDPRRASMAFLELLNSGGPALADFLGSISSPADGRLRQLVANAVRNHPFKDRLGSHLLAWQELETDEFTRRALAGALEGLDANPAKPRPAEPGLLASGTAETYRYVADRLRHRLRNAMIPAQAHLRRLRAIIPSKPGSELQSILDGLNEAVVTLGRELEATDVDPGYFEQKPIVLQDWLQQMNARYSRRYLPITLHLLPGNGDAIRLLASDYLLEVIFWNVWLNAQQAVGPKCEVTVQPSVFSNRVELLITDNGDGIPADVSQVAFRQLYSTKQPSRGRGLLEVQDAVERLHGSAKLVEATKGAYRLHLTLPVYQL